MPSLFLILALIGASGPPGTQEALGQDPEQEARTGQQPIVHLTVDAALRQWLVVRLLEDGYTLTTSRGVAHAQLAVVSNAVGGWRVTATGESTVTYDVEPAADAAVLRLELLHRSIDALEDVVPSSPSGSQPATVGLVVSELAPASLAPQVAAGVLAAGAVLVPAGTPSQLRVCADQASGEHNPRISVIDGNGECGADAGAGTVKAGDDALHSTTALVTAAIATLPAGVDPGPEDVAVSEPELEEPEEPIHAETDDERAPGQEPTRSRFRTPVQGAPRVLRLGVATGFISRGPVADALVAASMTVGREPGIRGWLELQARPVTVIGALRVIEVTPAIGFKLRPLTVGRVSLETGLLLGADIHAYQLEAEQATQRGSHTAASLESALGVAVQIWKLHEIHLGLRLGGGMERIHRVQGEEVWRRGAFRVGVTVGFSFGLGRST
ncbi:MAG: hypothetical protein ACRBN8_04915 [Nannocystales bacterium]